MNDRREMLSVYNGSPINVQNLPGHIRRIRACQVYIGRSELRRLPCPFHVQIGPGATPFTRMPFVASEADKERVKATIAPLVEE